MAYDIANNLGKVPLRSDTDWVFEATTVPTNTSTSSEAILFGKTLAGLEIVGGVDTKIVLSSAKTLTFTYAHGATYASTETIATFTAEADADLELNVGDELFRYLVPTDVESPGKVTITTDDAAVVGKVDVWIEYTGR